ncbi:Stf0 family sulfotransferase [Roseibaca sp. Y0-43]|uniref:Stf0 family sulfotransferase n=1 Tax=Roseibaca sp. Y0-43 TaxID=2816854 RepID=UPI001D0C896E|nr:Stf0 family sulfotransferase [Roseibaca sp. Y0-43]MCC1482862.1 hypothetical protein [Roseibaca sp. Y0-43]
MKKIILCATQRCGSTLVMEDMRNTGVLGMPEEWFIPWSPAKAGQNWREALASVYRRGTGDNGIFAVKIMANQLFNIDACLSTFKASTKGRGSFANIAEEFDHAAWVWLRRRDIVSQAISRLMAQQTGINHATARPEEAHFAGNLARGLNPDYNAKTRYDYEAILREITSINLENLAWADFFEQHRIKPISFEYEDVIEDSMLSHLDQMGAAVATHIGPTRPKRKMIKLGNERNREWRERFMAQAAEKNYR